MGSLVASAINSKHCYQGCATKTPIDKPLTCSLNLDKSDSVNEHGLTSATGRAPLHWCKDDNLVRTIWLCVSELTTGEWELGFAYNKTKNLAPTQGYVPRICEIPLASLEQQLIQSIPDLKILIFFWERHFWVFWLFGVTSHWDSTWEFKEAHNTR